MIKLDINESRIVSYELRDAGFFSRSNPAAFGWEKAENTILPFVILSVLSG